MKALFVGLLVLVAGCATTPVTRDYSYMEADECPAHMDENQKLSGLVRCRALCSSYGRDLAGFGEDCKCFCKPAPGILRAFPPAPTNVL